MAMCLICAMMSPVLRNGVSVDQSVSKPPRRIKRLRSCGSHGSNVPRVVGVHGVLVHFSSLWEGHVMIWGVPADTFTLIHTALSLVALAAGIVVVIGLACNSGGGGWTGLFLLTALATNV